MNFQGSQKDVVDGAEPVAKSRGRGRFAWIGTVASVVLVGASLVVLWRLVQSVTWAEVREALHAATALQLGTAFLFVSVSYLFLTGYDALALRQLRIKVPYRTTALASFTSYAVSFTLGFALLTAGTIRYWIYARHGVSATKIAALTVIAGFTFWLGMGVVLGLSLVIEAGQLAGLAFTSIPINQGAGFTALAIVLGYLVWVSAKKRHITVRQWRLELPGASVSIGQMIVGIGDVCAAAAVLYTLMPASLTLGFTTFLAVYVLAAMLGIASNAPGGIGVFEATILLALSGLPREEVLTSLLLFRGIYYLVPFVAALALLGAYEIATRTRQRRTAETEVPEP